MTDNLPTTDQCREFTLLLGVEWHESIRSDSLHEYCSCGAVLLNKRALNFHKATLNPTYDSATILAKMKEKLGEENYYKFLIYLIDEPMIGVCCFVDKFIFNPALLIGKAIEWMRKEKGE